MSDPNRSVVLASASAVRAEMLRCAGVDIDVRPADVDEDLIKSVVKAQNAAPEAVASALAEAKARKISVECPGRLVIGADQVMEMGGTIYDKPVDLTQARQHLLEMRGTSHRQIAAACIARNDTVCWRGVDSATVHIRAFSLAYLESYIKSVGTAALASVGCYQIEGLGAQLIARVEGDQFTVKGLPLFSLLEYLRGEGILTA